MNEFHDHFYSFSLIFLYLINFATKHNFYIHKLFPKWTGFYVVTYPMLLSLTFYAITILSLRTNPKFGMTIINGKKYRSKNWIRTVLDSRNSSVVVRQISQIDRTICVHKVSTKHCFHRFTNYPDSSMKWMSYCDDCSIIYSGL